MPLTRKRAVIVIPNFGARPAQNTAFLPEIVRFLQDQGATALRVDGVFDLLITDTRDGIDKYLELKVRLASKTAKSAVPLTPQQWRFLSGFPTVLAERFRILIYDHAALKYCLCTVATFTAGIPRTEPKYVWYPRRTFLK